MNEQLSHYITFNNETHTVKEWSQITGISQETLKYRLKSNWEIKDILTKETKRKMCHTFTFNDETHTISEWSKITGINQATISSRLKANWEIKDVLAKNIKMPRLDLKGRTYDRLTVREYVGKNKQKINMWLCDCECGNTKIITINELHNKARTKSCGCLQREQMSRYITFNNETHNVTEWSQITGIKRTTLNARLRLNWEIKDVLAKEAIHEICQLTFNNETHNISEWSQITGINQATLRSRLQSNWEIEDVLTKDVLVKKPKRTLTFENETHTITEWSQITGIKRTTLRRRLKSKWEIKDVLTQEVKHPLNSK